ncbi:MAG: hypothetical protein NVS4B3_05180 [Gemmatimonadaceae bacterium]
MNPQYTDSYLKRLYSTYTPRGTPEDSSDRMRARFLEKEVRVAAVERFVKPGHILSIGVGDGVELEVARRRGWTVTGYDVDRATTEQVSRRLGIPILSGNIFEANLQDASFDAVFMDQVLEHPKNPGEYLRLARRILRKRGVLYVGVPNVSSVSSTYQRLMGRAGLKPRRGRHYDTWHHLFYYGPQMLRNILERYYGFDVLTVEGDPRPSYPSSRVDRLRMSILTAFPVLDSSMRLVARPRPDHPLG